MYFVPLGQKTKYIFHILSLLAIPRQELTTCARETLGEHLYISNIQLSETKKNLIGIFINGDNTLSLQENIKLFFCSPEIYLEQR